MRTKIAWPSATASCAWRRSYDTRRREDALNYQDNIELGASRRAAAAHPTAPSAEQGQPDVREHLVTEEMDCEEESSGAPAP